MKENRDPWFIRLPDGRVLKAKSTSAVVHHIEAGHIPLNSFARREPHEEWVSLAWIKEFSDRSIGGRTPASVHDHAPTPPVATGSNPDVNIRSGVSARLDPLKLQTVGVRGYIEELFAALDSTINRSKLWTACLTGIVVALAGVLLPHLSDRLQHLFTEERARSWPGDLAAAVASLLVLAFGITIITRQTHQELSTMRPASWKEARAGAGPFFLRLFILYLVLGGVAYGIVILFRQLPEWIGPALPAAAVEPVLTAVSILGLVVAVGLAVALLMALLLAPILVVEEGSAGDAVREWRALVREHYLRIFLYEGLAIGLGLVVTLPLAIPAGLAMSYGPPLVPNLSSPAARAALGGFVIGPFIGFLAVANVFVYLNLRYEYSPAK